MKQTPFTALSCPLDRQPLVQRGQSLYCPQNHCFDIDRRGAINLLPVQFKKSLEPGDSAAMVAARRDFLDAGFYKPIAEKLNQLVSSHISRHSQQNWAILDAGCGEGYYTAALADSLTQAAIDAAFSLTGLDISKPAVSAASRRAKDIGWLVGTNKILPVPDAALDIILCLFGFPVWPEFARALKLGGIVITCDPGPDHLIELRRVLYPEINQKHPSLSEDCADWAVLQQENLTQTIETIPAAQIVNLLTMTPHGHRATAERKERALATLFSAMTIDVDFKLNRDSYD